MAKRDTTVYYRTYGEAQAVADKLPKDQCCNRFQMKGDRQCGLVREYGRGYAVQLGDCGAYVDKARSA